MMPHKTTYFAVDWKTSSRQLNLPQTQAKLAQNDLVANRGSCKSLIRLVAGDGIEPPTRGFMVEACNVTGCSSSHVMLVTDVVLDTNGSFKVFNTDAGDGFGHVALSADGRTLAVGAAYEASSATGINGDQANNSANNSGAVYVY